MTIEKPRILFVCTGNIFRSMSAEYALKKYLKDNNLKNFQVSSAGTVAKKEPAHPSTIKTLKQHSIDPSKHKQRKLTKKILEENDVIIAMDKHHQDFITKKFNHSSILFEKLAINRNSSLKDVDEAMPDYKKHMEKVPSYISRIVKEIIKQTPLVYKELYYRNYLFTDFVRKRARHRKDLPFIPLYETKNTLAFMSIDIPEYEDGHILVIPKKRFPDFHKIPKQIQNELTSSINTIAQALKTNHAGYNILLNNGIDAGQYMFHTHFHIIPRKQNDKIKIEVWKGQKLNKRKFIEYNKKIKDAVKSVTK
jgi:diadenosine tetraphosphate (Ap4A) HIT family hydrolase/protein-tyrosine-phosphatase